jgi:hypothetical protein
MHASSTGLQLLTVQLQHAIAALGELGEGDSHGCLLWNTKHRSREGQ